MSFVQYVPEELMQMEKKEEVIELLKTLPIKWHIKKYTLLEWGNLMNVKITGKDIEKLHGKNDILIV